MPKHNKKITDKISILTREGKKKKQAVAIALSMTRKNLKKKAPKNAPKKKRY